MRLLHTSDWHLGHVLHDRPRTFEHAQFLRWLLKTLEQERIDALIVAGDIFDVANPSTEALNAFYGFLGDARRRLPNLSLVVVGGNHDSPSRLDVTNPVLDAFGVRVVGGVPRRPDESLDLERLLVPLPDATGTIAAWCVAVPFLRPVDLPTVTETGLDPLVEGVRRLYAEAFDAARARRTKGQALLATGHAYLSGTSLSEKSERPILVGNQHPLPVDVFPADLAYVALGHLHRAQSVGGRDEVRYCGSPIPLSFTETDYRHQVVVVDLEGERASSIRAVPIPRSVPLLRLPAAGPKPLAEVLEELRALPRRTGLESDPARPLLEVRVRCDRPEPNLRHDLEAALSDRTPRLLKIETSSSGDGRGLGESMGGSRLNDLRPDDVFRRCYADAHGGEPSPALSAAFAELLEHVEREGGTP